MFTGIIEAVGRLREIKPAAGGVRIAVDTGTLDLADVKTGDSIAVNGVCLTVVALAAGRLDFDVSRETLDCTAGFGEGARVNLEKSLRLADRLGDRFRLLTGGGRGAVPRQQTLQATIDWSWDLLEEADRALLRRLSVFAGGWTLEAAAVVTGAADPIETLDGLASGFR